MSSLPKIVLKRGKEKPLLRGHPWVFSGAVKETVGELSEGTIGEAYSEGGEFLGTGYVNPRSQIIFRLLSTQKEPIDGRFLRNRIAEALTLRAGRSEGEKEACRLINGEGDFLPGLFVDRYGEILVVQISTAGMEGLKNFWVEALVELLRPRSVYERSDVPTRREEGLLPATGLLYGKELPDRVEIREYEACFWVDVKRGQKTGFYLDQRENRHSVKERAYGKRVLDAFCYTGGFSVFAGIGGAAELTLIDSSQEALSMAESNLMLNGLSEIPRRLLRGDGFELMRDLEPGYDLIVLDPPPFAKRKGHLPSASRGYKDLNLQAFRLLRGGGLLYTFCCSHHVTWDLFQKIVFSAALDAGKNVQVLERRGQPFDHPFNVSHPEGEYLKGLVCRVL